MIQRLLLFLVLAVSLAAAPYTRIVAFGDSLTDNGNLYALNGGTYPPSPPYFGGRGSNGPVAVEYMSTALGLPLLDFAVYGATRASAIFGDVHEVRAGLESPFDRGIYIIGAGSLHSTAKDVRSPRHVSTTFSKLIAT